MANVSDLVLAQALALGFSPGYVQTEAEKAALTTSPNALILQSQLAQVQSIIASGLTRGSYEGKSTEFRTMSELYRIRDDLLAQLSPARPIRSTVIGYSGGF